MRMVITVLTGDLSEAIAGAIRPLLAVSLAVVAALCLAACSDASKQKSDFDNPALETQSGFASSLQPDGASETIDPMTNFGNHEPIFDTALLFVIQDHPEILPREDILSSKRFVMCRDYNNFDGFPGSGIMMTMGFNPFKPAIPAESETCDVRMTSDTRYFRDDYDIFFEHPGCDFGIDLRDNRVRSVDRLVTDESPEAISKCGYRITLMWSGFLGAVSLSDDMLFTETFRTAFFNNQRIIGDYVFRAAWTIQFYCRIALDGRRYSDIRREVEACYAEIAAE